MTRAASGACSISNSSPAGRPIGAIPAIPACRRRSTFRRARNVSAAELSFPAPQRHDDGYGKWAGYDHPVALAGYLRASAPRTSPHRSTPTFSSASAKRSACRCRRGSNCDPASDPDNAENAALVTAAFAALPAPAGPEFRGRADLWRRRKDVHRGNIPGAPEAVDLFVAGTDGYMFGAPERHVRGRQADLHGQGARPAEDEALRQGHPLHADEPGGCRRRFLPYP